MERGVKEDIVLRMEKKGINKEIYTIMKLFILDKIG